MKYLLIISFLFSFDTIQSQNPIRKVGIELGVKLDEMNENEKIELVFVSKNGEVEAFLSENEIIYKSYFSTYYRILASRDQVISLSNSPFVDYFEYSGSKPTLMNDSMRSLNYINPVHRGDKSLSRGLKGDGVLIGFIDSGIDFTHPDFQDSIGRSRVLKIWDQVADTLISSRIPSFGYGQVWDSADINSNSCPHDDDVLSHGTNVAGIAAGNGLALNKFEGAAPEADLIMVASDFSSSNWLQTVADGVEYIFKEADLLNKPCVINISAGEYLGSHDGTDLAALRIDSLIKEKKGRALVAAAGNSGNINYHLGYNVSSDTTFTWLQYNSNSSLGYGAVYTQLWADTADFENVSFAFGANLSSGSFAQRGQTSFDLVSNRLGGLYTDSIMSGINVIAYVQTYVTTQDDKYLFEIHMKEPDSSHYLFSFLTTGSGSFDIWSDTWLGHSHIYKSPLPTSSVYPAIVNYREPDTLKTIVSSFTCLESVITVGNYICKNAYLDYDSVWQTFPVIPGKKADNSSLGPTRRNALKPDLMASGDYTLTPNRLASIPLHIANNQSDRIAKGGFHKRNGGTSMAAPVVSGVVALMFEQCPESDHQVIKQKLIDGVYQDNFTTSNVPNYSYGHGKCHAFNSVIDVPDKPTITRISYLELESSIAEQYQWYRDSSIIPNETDRVLLLSASGADNAHYQVETRDSNACPSISDSYFYNIWGIESEKRNMEIELVPNPSSSRNLRLLNRSHNGHEYYELTIYGPRGDTSYRGSVQENDVINLHHLSSGIYFYSLKAESSRISEGKLVLN